MSVTPLSSSDDSLSLIKRISRNLRWNVVSEVGAKGLLFLAMLLLARNLGADKFGVFTLAHISVTYAWLLVNLGISMYGPREVAKYPESSIDLLSVLFSVRLTAGFLVLFLFVVGTFILINNNETKAAFLAFSSYLLFRAIYSEWYLKGKEKFNLLAIANLGTFSFFFISVYFFVKDDSHLLRASILWSASYLLGAFIISIFIYRTNGGKFCSLNFNLSKWQEHLKESIYFSVSGGLSVIYQYIPILLIGIWYDSNSTGVFSATHKLIVYCTFVLSIGSLAIYPILSKYYLEDVSKLKKLLHRSFVVLALISTIIGIFTSYYSEDISVFLLGEDYRSGAIVLAILAIYLVLRVLRELLVLAVSAAGLQSKTIPPFFIGLIILVALFVFYWQTDTDMTVLQSSSIAVVCAELVVFILIVKTWFNFIKDNKVQGKLL